MPLEIARKPFLPLIVVYHCYKIATSPMNMRRRDQYRSYLKSATWSDQRDLTLSRTEGFCQFCGDMASQVHHVKYPKRFGDEHPHSLVPVCERCHNISHGVQDMKPLTNVVQMTELSPNGGQLRYLLCGARVYASAKSWGKALQVPEAMRSWFENGLPRTAVLKKDLAGGGLEMLYLNTAVYRWHAVAELLRAFDRQWHLHQFKSRPKSEQRDIERFNDNYERLVSWGYDLQERALSSALTATTSSAVPATQEMLLEALKHAVAPRLAAHDDKLHEHDVVIAELKEVVPTLRDQDEFIPVKQSVSEQGFDPTLMPLHPQSNENLSGLTGQMLKSRRAEQGASVIARIDGQSFSTEMRTYRRKDIYAVLVEITRNKQHGLLL